METKEKNKMTLEMWTDFMCPLCYIGKVNLENALSEFLHKDDVEITHRPFQLYPEAPSNTGKDYYAYTSMTHGGLPIDYVKEANKKVIALAKTLGLAYNLDILIPTNTSSALRISLYAQECGKVREWSSRIYKAYFIEGLDIGDPQTLGELGAEIGLDESELLNILKSDRYKSELKKERAYAESIGISGTPFSVVNGKYGIAGVKSKEDFLNILNDFWEENKLAIIPLSLAEKQTLKKAFNFRIKIGLLFILPILFGSASLCVYSIVEFSTNDGVWTSIFCTGFFILCLFLFLKLAVPYYRQTFKNILAKDKLIIETVIIDIKSNWDYEFGYSYTIQTESPVPIVSTINRLLNPAFGYKDMRSYMRVRIHCMEDNMMDILYIEPI